MKKLRFFCVFLLWIALVKIASAHEGRPVYVQIKEIRQGEMKVQWRVPRALPAAAMPTPVLPEHCKPVSERIVRQQPDAWLNRQNYRCNGPIAEHKIGIRYPAHNPSLSTLYRIELISGERYLQLLSPDETFWQVPEGEDRLSIIGKYMMLGIRHILLGIDHLLFVFCLLLIAGPGRRLITTITGFTIAHSSTLILSALNVVRVPVPPVEAAIALSIVFLASEIALRNKDSLTFRYPAGVSASFGLLHGFGFAAVLRETGLPQTEIPTALLFFNLGVEIGQLLFVGALIALFLGFLWRVKDASSLLSGFTVIGGIGQRLVSYGIGSTAVFWLIQRIAVFLS